MKVKKVCIIIAIASIVLGSGLVRGSGVLFPALIIISVASLSKKEGLSKDVFGQIQITPTKKIDFSDVQKRLRSQAESERRNRMKKTQNLIMTCGYGTISSRRIHKGW